MSLKIVRNDLTKVFADVIVDTAKTDPIIGTGSDLVIYETAGKDALLAERLKIGKISFGDAAITPACKLFAKYIIHAVAPIWKCGNHDELKLLRQCYRKSLELAVEKNCRSIAFPLLGTGNNRIPKDKALLAATAEIQKFLLTHDLEA